MTFLNPSTIACSLMRSRIAAEQLVGQAERAGQRGAGVVRRVGQHRQRDRVAQLQRDRLDGLPRHQVVAAVDVLRPAMFGAAGVDERRGLSRGQRRFHLGPRHHLELDVVHGARWRSLRLGPRCAAARRTDLMRQHGAKADHEVASEACFHGA